MRKLLQKIWYRNRYTPPKEFIFENSARCLICTDHLYSVTKEKVRCTCGNLTISGGLKRLVRDFETDLWAETSRTSRRNDV